MLCTAKLTPCRRPCQYPPSSSGATPFRSISSYQWLSPLQSTLIFVPASWKAYLGQIMSLLTSLPATHLHPAMNLSMQ